MHDLHTLTQGRPIAIVGAGLVGSGWALVFARAGLNVRIFDANPTISSAAVPLIKGQIADLTAHGLLSESAETILARLTVCDTLAQAVEGAVYVQESILERTDVKRQLMLELEAVAAPDLVVAGESHQTVAAAAAFERVAARGGGEGDAGATRRAGVGGLLQTPRARRALRRGRALREGR